MRFDNYRKVVTDVIKSFSDDTNIEICSIDNDDIISMSKAWYLGYVEDFHQYKLYNGRKHVDFRKKQLRIYKKTCEDFASLLLNEKFSIGVNDDEDTEKLNAIFDNNNFYSKANQGVELSFALGFGYFVEGVDGLKLNDKKEIVNDKTGEVTIEFVNADKVMPLIIENGKVTDVAFIKINTLDTVISVHCKDRREQSPTKGNYFITNIVLKNNGSTQQGTMANATKEITRVQFNTMGDRAWFQQINPNVVNNLWLDSTLTLPLCYNSISSLEAIDTAYDSLDTEVFDGKRKTFVSEDLIAKQIDENGNSLSKPFDSNDCRFYILPKDIGIDDSKQLIQESAPLLRTQQIIEALNKQLSVFTSKVGMGENFYKFDGSSVATATQVISENSALYRSIRKHEIVLRNALRNLVKAVIHIENEFTNDKFAKDYENKDINICFDDSIFEDTATEKNNDKADVEKGIMTNVEYRMKWYAENEETAHAKVGYLDLSNFVSHSIPLLENGILTPEQFVERLKAFDETINTDGMIESITKSLEEGKSISFDPFADENPDINELTDNE